MFLNVFCYRNCLNFIWQVVNPLILQQTKYRNLYNRAIYSFVTVFKKPSAADASYWLIDWGWTPFLTISQSYHGGQFTFTRFSWFSHTSTPHNNLPKQLAAFPQRLSPLVEDEWRMSHRLLSNYGKKVGQAEIRIRGHRKHLYEGKG